MPRFLVPIFVLLAGLGTLAFLSLRDAPLSVSDPPARLRIERGMGLSAIGDAVARSGAGWSSWQFQLAARLRGESHRIQAGVYELRGPLSRRGLMGKLLRGEVLMAEVRIIEGWTFLQMRQALARHPDLQQDAAALSDAQLLARIGASEAHPEGLFMPSTYRFAPGTADLDIYRQSYRLMKRTLDEAWSARSAAAPLATPYEALVLASIVEKETGRDADRERIAGVFANRLRMGMMLQSDPTTIYGLGARFDGNLRRADLRADTPYNTYTRRGLPPTPIALPGKASLAAALNPHAFGALYFVARGDGSSEFSNDLSAHQRAVDRYQRKGGS